MLGYSCVLASLAVLFLSECAAVQEEYCQIEIFNATCAEDEVILMKSADYGRIFLGRCLTRDYGLLGCSVDMLSHVDSLCSGRRTCEFAVPTEAMKQSRACPDDMSSYLDVSYICLKVQVPDKSVPPCEPGSGHLNVHTSSGYLSSLVAEEKGYGSIACPWTIHVDPGQQVKITLLDFSVRDSVPQDDSNIKVCHVYAVIREKASSRSDNVCGGGSRERHTYTSNQNSVDVRLMRYEFAKSNVYFLLKFEAIGCPVFVPPKDSLVEQSGSRLIITCKHTREKSFLACEDKMWVGELKSCSQSDGLPAGALMMKKSAAQDGRCRR